MEFAGGVQHQHSTTQTQLQQQVAAAASADPVLHSISSTVVELSQDLFWCANTGQLAAAELFSIPAAYQPRVKDLTAPGAACLMAMDGLCDVSTPLAAPEDVQEVGSVSVFTIPVLLLLNGPTGDQRFHDSPCCVQQPVLVCTTSRTC